MTIGYRDLRREWMKELYHQGSLDCFIMRLLDGDEIPNDAFTTGDI